MKEKYILDTNLSILFFVGTTNPKYIEKHKRCRMYDERDYEILLSMIENSSGVIFTPNVLSETSNLLRQIDDPIRTEISKAFKNIIHRATEEIVESRIAVARSEFVRLGLTDSVLLEAASKGLTILTADLDLYLAALSSNLSAINYTHIQEERSDFQ